MRQENSNSHAHEHHSTWVENVMVKLEEAIHNIDTDFPLSGGDEPSLHTHHARHMTEEERAEVHEKWSRRLAFLHPNVTTEFPLSGGEF